MPKLTPKGKLFTDLLLEVFRLNGALLEAGDDLCGPVGLSSARWQVLGVVEHGPVPVAHVARIMGLSRQTVQQTANGLERDGFIDFVDNPHHRRAKLMQLTLKGQTALEYLIEQQALWANQIGQQHTREGLQRALEQLQGLRASLEQDKAQSTRGNK